MAGQTENSISTRDLALNMLIEINEKGAYSHLVLRQVLDKYQYLEKRDRAFLTRLVEGSMEHRLELDFLIDAFSKTKVRKMKPLIRNLLRMSAYQLKYMDSIPDSAVCNEAVKLAKKHGFGQLSGFVNGVLRNLARNMDQVALPSEEKDEIGYLELKYSMPRWILEQFAADYGMAQTRRILEGFAREYPLTIRTNQNRISPQALRDRLQAEGVTAEPITGSGDRKDRRIPDYALAISGFDYLNALASFEEGLFYVQDLSSMMVAEAADPKPGDVVIDVCAAPGGKSSHLAEKLGGTGLVEARDLTEYKTALIEDNIARHGLANMKAVCMDATVYDADSVERADILICDLPCSGLGVLGRKTDIRYKESKENEKSLTELQKKILSVVYCYVKKGGTLIYSTCTMHKAENEDMVQWFLREHPEFELIGQEQFYPGDPGADGFYLAKLIRRS